MTAPRPVLARKARRNSKLACGCYVQVGSRIIRCPDGRWRCVPCVLAPLMASKDVPPGTRPGGQSTKEK